MSRGSHTISAPVELDSSLTVLPAAGSGLTISGGITGAGALTVDDRGTVVLSGTNGYTGGTTVSAGTLILTGASAIPANSDLTIGAGASQIFASSALFAATAATPLIASSEDATASNATTSSNGAHASVSSVATATTAATVAKRQGTSSFVSSMPRAADIGRTRLAGSNSQSPIVPPAAFEASQSFPAGVLGAPAADRFVPSSTARRIAGDLAWLRQAGNSSDNSDQHRRKDVAILALEAVFAQYGQ
ncbi:MAG: autotransporter-associated beta strand repeat-containing protein [Thermoguttaceae bacterium]